MPYLDYDGLSHFLDKLKTTFPLSSTKGEANGLAELDSNGKVPSSQLPSYVDDVLEFDSKDFSDWDEWVSGTSYAVGNRVKITDVSENVNGYICKTANEDETFDESKWDVATKFPTQGNSGVIYIDTNTNLTYRWSGSAYVSIASDLALGETSSTAYRGDRGAAAYAAAVTNVDTTPTEGSTHLVTSGGVKAAIPDISGKADKDNPIFTGSISLGRKENTTVGDNSVAIGAQNEASGTRSFALGTMNKATYLSAFAEGDQTTASGQAAHAEGSYTTANGQSAHAEGQYTIAKGQAQHAGGKYNVQDNNYTYAEIIGNGVDQNNRANARALTWTGDERLKGDLYVGCNADSTGGTKVTPLPAVTSSDDGKSLEVSNGSWATGSKKIDKEYDTSDWLAKTWTGLTEFTGQYIWTDGENIYYSYSTTQYVLNKSTSTCSEKTWTGLTNFYGNYIWTDGENIYYSSSSDQYVLNKTTSTWSKKSWNGISSFNGDRIWTDGENIYYSYNLNQYILNKPTSTWSAKSWTGLTNFNGLHVWTAGDNIYYSKGSSQYILNKSNSTWSTKSWTGLTSFYGSYIWTDGENIYYNYGSDKYILDKLTSTWSTKSWTGLEIFDARYVWTDGKNIYYSDSSNQYKFNKHEDQILIGRNGEFTSIPVSAFSIPGTLPDITSTDNGKSLEVSNGAWAVGSKKIDKEYALQNDWSTKAWNYLTSFSGEYVWTDGENTYYSFGADQYVLDKSTSTWSAKTWTGLTSFFGSNVWTDGENIYYSDSSSSQYVLDKSTSTWSTKTWTGYTAFYGEFIWTDGENIYYSSGSSQRILDTSTSTWSTKTWTGLTQLYRNYIWTDGENIYHSDGTNQYILDKSTSAWSTKTWTGLTSFSGDNIWTDGENIYYSSGSNQYILDKSTSIWSVKTWTGLTSFSGARIWTDDENIYYSYDNNQYQFNKPEDQILIGRNGEFTHVPAKNLILPAAPSSDGTYILQCSVSNGTATYSWVSLPNASGVSF